MTTSDALGATHDPLVDHEGVLVATLASGSRGNCTYIGDARRGVLVDCGISARQVLERLAAVGLGDVRIEAVLLTHEHTDHVAAAGVLDRRLAKAQGAPVPFYVTAGTLEGMAERIRPQRLEPVRAGDRLPWADGVLEAHAVPHDTLEPVAWTVVRGHARAGVVTDLGHAPRLVERLLASLDVAVVEFNHDEQLLLDGPYPWQLKQRIRGRHGHLSNAQAADLVERGVGSRLRHLVLAHLSEENNTPAHAHEAAQAALHAIGRAGQVRVHIAEQARPLPAVHATGTPPPRPVQPTLFGAGHA